MSIDPLLIVTPILFVAGGLWMLTLSWILAGVRAEQNALRATIGELKSDLKVDAVQTRLDLTGAVRAEIAYALGSRPAITQTNIDQVRAAQDAYLGATHTQATPHG